ncbi:glycosyl transferase [Flavihumibacter rivuli]|uniref:glycosyltransferase family protein n=1 Tax=Flavihumibacter rivuli TaxID=2838156 RepID=UPI001BDEC62A|nr:glycosyltransferase family protein [Flavihumibacter rivuli]ULQ55366.1 glycosyl transferase [Flavihumibacter rivuli]
MKIFYAVQATGNGHISRAGQLLPYLRRFGKVDVFLSGSNSQLNSDLPVKYRSKGLSLFYNRAGGLRYGKIASQLNLPKLYKEIRELPVEAYDVVINDFEAITSLACAVKNVPSVGFGHQASFQSSRVPRPARKEWIGEGLLKHYARSSQYVGLHFQPYDDFIFTPVIKKEILMAKPQNKGHITVYLSAYSDDVVLKELSKLKAFRFQVFSKERKQVETIGNVCFIPINQRLFNESIINSYGVVTGAGFETPAEVLQLGKKLMAIPIKGQYEQYCNAAALEPMGVKVLASMDGQFADHFFEWINREKPNMINYPNIIPEALTYLFDNYPSKGVPLDLLYSELMIA